MLSYKFERVNFNNLFHYNIKFTSAVEFKTKLIDTNISDTKTINNTFLIYTVK